MQEDNKDLDNKTESQCSGTKTINKTTNNDSDNNDNNNTMKNYLNTNNRIIKPFSNYSTNSYNYRKKKYPKINKINYPKPISIKMKERTNEFNTLDDEKTDMSFSNDMNLEQKNIINKKKEKVLDKSFDIAKKEITPFTKKILNKNKENQKIYISKKISDKNGEQKLINYERNTIGCSNISNNNKIYNDFLNAQNNKNTSKAYVKKTPDTSKVFSTNNTIDDIADNPKNAIYKNKKHLNKTLMKPTQNINTIEANYPNKTGLNQDTSTNKKVDTISTDYGTNKISKIKNMKDNRQQNKTEIIFNLEDLMILEERLNDIILALESNDNIANKCFNYWNYYYNCSLSNLIEKIFKNKEDSNIVRLSFNYELISIMVCYEYSFEIDSLSKQIFYLLIELIELNHSNLMIICEYILSKIDPENKQNIWVLKLQQIIKGSKPFQSIGDKNKYPKNTIKAIDLNASLLIAKLRYILQKYPTEYSDIYFSLINNLDTFSYEEINNFFRKYILRVDNFEGSIVASSYLKKKKYYEPFSPPYLTYPSPRPYTLVLDLDETLVHFKIKSNKGGTLRARPYLFSFLEEMGHYYELIIWTSATEKYANSLIDAIESEKKYFDYILFREHAIIIDNDFVKDLRRIGRKLDRIIMIDDMPQNYRLQKENGINIKPFFGDDMDDTALYDLIPILKHIAESGKDARVELNKYREEIVKKVTSNISKK
jgi:CTD small phosphatase-like protein 2